MNYRTRWVFILSNFAPQKDHKAFSYSSTITNSSLELFAKNTKTDRDWLASIQLTININETKFESAVSVSLNNKQQNQRNNVNKLIHETSAKSVIISSFRSSDLDSKSEHKQAGKAPAEGSMVTLKSSKSSFHVLTGTSGSTRHNRSAVTTNQSVQLSKYFSRSSSDQLVSCGLSPDGEDQHSRNNEQQQQQKKTQVQRRNV